MTSKENSTLGQFFNELPKPFALTKFQEPRVDKGAKKQENIIICLCSVLILYHFVHFCYSVDEIRRVTNDGVGMHDNVDGVKHALLKAEAAIEFVAIWPLLGLAVAPCFITRFQNMKKFKNDVAIESTKNCAVLAMSCYVYVIESVVIVLDGLTAAKHAKASASTANLALNIVHILIVCFCSLWLGFVINEYYQHNKKRSDKFDEEKTKKTKKRKDAATEAATEATISSTNTGGNKVRKPHRSVYRTLMLSLLTCA